MLRASCHVSTRTHPSTRRAEEAVVQAVVSIGRPMAIRLVGSLLASKAPRFSLSRLRELLGSSRLLDAPPCHAWTPEATSDNCWYSVVNTDWRRKPALSARFSQKQQKLGPLELLAFCSGFFRCCSACLVVPAWALAPPSRPRGGLQAADVLYFKRNGVGRGIIRRRRWRRAGQFGERHDAALTSRFELSARTKYYSYCRLTAGYSGLSMGGRGHGFGHLVLMHERRGRHSCQ